MRKGFICLSAALMFFGWTGCTNQDITFQEENLELINRDIVSISETNNTLILDQKVGDGMAILKGTSFQTGTIEVELKGENNPGRSFVGIAFNIQNDSTYEAIYFRPFNFQSDNEVSRFRSIQYIHHPEFTWRYLRTNHEGQFETEFPRQPSPDDWFSVRIDIEPDSVFVFDTESNMQIHSVERLTDQVSDKMGLWTGFNSKGEFRNLRIKQ